MGRWMMAARQTWDRRAGLNLPAAACTYAENYETQLWKDIVVACQSVCRKGYEGAPRQALSWLDPRTVGLWRVHLMILGLAAAAL